MSSSSGNLGGVGIGGGSSDLVAAAACLFLSSEQEMTDGILDVEVLAARAGTRSLTSTLEAIVACIGETTGLTSLDRACTALGWERLREPLGRLHAHVITTASGALRTQLAACSPVTMAGLLLAIVKTVRLPPRLIGIICTRLHANRQQSQRCAELIITMAAPQLNMLKEDAPLVEHLRTQPIRRLKRRDQLAPSLSDKEEAISPPSPNSRHHHSPDRPSRSIDYIGIHAAHELGYTWMVSQAPTALT